jgi:hypothetical protein
MAKAHIATSKFLFFLLLKKEPIFSKISMPTVEQKGTTVE